jgi:hypothetical protein
MGKRKQTIHDRIATLIDGEFNGNLTVAARVIGVDYHRLRGAYMGFTQKVAADIAMPIARHFQVPLDELYGEGK